MQTRSKSGIFKPKCYVAITSIFYTPDTTLPTSVSAALKNPKWKASMNIEFKALQKNNTWTVVPYSSNMKIVGHKWLF